METLLRKVEKKRSLSSSRLSLSLQPLGRFLCPQCNSYQVISRLGITVLPLVHTQSQLPASPLLHRDKKPASPVPSPAILNRFSNTSSDPRCSQHMSYFESYCYNCNKQLCKECVVETHMLHHIGRI